MSRQYFADVIIDPPIANLTAITTLGDAVMWNAAQFTPIHAFDAYKGVGKIYRIQGGGIISTAASAPGNITLTPRVGTTTGGVTLGASQTAALPTSLASQPWFLEFTLVVRTLGAPGINSTCIGTGYYSMPNQASAGSADFQLFLGGTSATVDLSIETGLIVTWNFSATVAGNSMTPQYVFIQSLN
jgi:hypothetical protein